MNDRKPAELVFVEYAYYLLGDVKRSAMFYAKMVEKSARHVAEVMIEDRHGKAKERKRSGSPKKELKGKNK